MAKLAIALCILLAACTAQRWDMPEFIREWYEGMKEMIREEIEKLEQHMKDALRKLEEYRVKWEEKIQAAIKEWQDKIDNIVGTADSVRICTKKVNFEEINKEVQATVAKCLDESIAKIQQDYDAAKAAFDELVKDLNHAWERFTECSNDGGWIDTHRCMKEIYDEKHVEIGASWDEFKDKVATFGSDVANLPSQLTSCGAEGVELAEQKLRAAYEGVKKCVAEMDSNNAS